MPRRFCIETTNGEVCGEVFTGDTERCPPHQQAADQRLQAKRGTTTMRGYGAIYQRNRRIIVDTALENAKQGTPQPCHICEKPCLTGQKLTAEHVIPVRHGGTHRLVNLRPAHAGCNYGWNRGTGR